MNTHLPEVMQPGFRAELGSHTFKADEIIEFAKKFDPQPFHLDAELAKNSVLGGLCASGWHTASMWMMKQREFSAKWMAEREASGLPMPEYGPSPGFQNLRWLRPVFAGDTITYWNEIVAVKASNSKPGWHVLTTRSGAQNQNGDPVLTFDSAVFVRYVG